MIRFDVLSVFPEMLHSPLDFSLLKKAREKGLIEVGLYDIRDWAQDKHKMTDDAPYGGGCGMVMKVEPVERAVNALKRADVDPLVVLMTPQGETFNQRIALELSRQKHLIFICGRYEGVDERIRKHLANREISIGDYILTGGELSALVVIDAVARLIPGVLGNAASAQTESFSQGLLECPQYTRPADYKGWCVPEVLVSGNHARIESWQRIEALKRTWKRRPDLLEKVDLSKEDREALEKIKLGLI
ncbi:MAG: tRNA (guanine-N(1)-)-methyltransferase [Deltaproteobacteria bacterium ADurb.Bin151]|nr:MAG: tRNA (guanine-N(1)-)-methyltransferase [Deltaproteobacteria bacterium ADurb.Bin151]HOG82204.1 tRNA (guanosine(37)-N1)-methyltransferase TrmD [Smithellaceae bacterium]HOQ42152.1 tRNA (guanosine(37)-N1)-methyltransferase TrmD [Smithellaceae bacterium]HPL65855.1 tRNA (guanosine(37)-N1)-methyltransferase TrmD [Smithellaceae bacterium]HRY35074.1 tRNA (guanosine(37)-N1)-methyltransferase TrmD [Smithellaceae bacterium]